MVRKLSLAALLAAGTIAGMSPGTASAQLPMRYPAWPGSPMIFPPRPLPTDRHDHGHGHGHGHGHRHYTVLVRHRNHWDVYSTHRERDDAIRAARRLEYRGYDARIERSVVR